MVNTCISWKIKHHQSNSINRYHHNCIIKSLIVLPYSLPRLTPHMYISTSTDFINAQLSQFAIHFINVRIRDLDI